MFFPFPVPVPDDDGSGSCSESDPTSVGSLYTLLPVLGLGLESADDAEEGGSTAVVAGVKVDIDVW